MKLKTILFLIFLSFTSCNDYDDEILELQNEINQLKEIQSLLELKNILYKNIVSEILVSEIKEESNILILSFENGTKYIIENKFIKSHSKDAKNWVLKFILSDQTEIEMNYIGDKFEYKDIKLDPFNTAPLSLLINKKTPVKGKFKIKIIGQDGPSSDFILDSKTYTNEHSLEVFGLYSNYNNEIEISFTNKDGKERSKTIINVQTKKLPEQIPDFQIEKKYSSYKQNTLILVNYRVRQQQSIPFMVDPHGKVRWYSVGFAKVRKYGLQRLKNGNIAFGVSGKGQGRIYEYDMMGEMKRLYDFYGKYENIHHDLFEMKNGNFLVTVDKVGIETIEDFIIEIDRTSGVVGNVWDLREVLQMDRFTFRQIKGGTDWFHTNAVIHDDRDNSIIVSGQAQGLAKVSWENKLKWILAPHDGWDDDYKEYLLQPKGNPFEWSWGQHAPQILNNGNIMIFDNGFGRGFGTAPSNYSRSVEYNIEETEKGGEISQVWEYGKERGEDMFSPFISDIDYLEDSSTVFLTCGSTSFDLEYNNLSSSLVNNIDQIETRIIEVNRSKEVIFEMVINSNNVGTTYRSEKLVFD